MALSYLKSQITLKTSLELVYQDNPKANIILLHNKSMQEKEYWLDVNSNQVKIKVRSSSGYFYAKVTE